MGAPAVAASPGAPPWSRVAVAAVVVALALSLAGTALSSYLVYENLQGETGVCVIAHGCSTVQNSVYGKIGGVPVSVPGAALYVGLTLGAVLWLRNLRPGRPALTVLSFYGALFGALFSGYLTYLEAFVIDAWCIYCLVSASLVGGLLLIWAGLLASTMRRAS